MDPVRLRPCGASTLRRIFLAVGVMLAMSSPLALADSPPAGPLALVNGERPTDYDVIAASLPVFLRYVVWPEDHAPTGTPLRTGGNIRYRLDDDALSAQGLRPTAGLLGNALPRSGPTATLPR